ncbi:NADP-dependent oxidoreductase [Granulicella sp. WH15]|uniref:NADP-dependent oxidoreductase n=1 Tax=Granulicella sp. WH15 TaxID=2602070 RepID=UPI001366E058|nr:NADP-dependent oxidoreductase [Granulicella sp. WH15]QHN03623.1 NADP-dependent oxidoreductase [Granulicella sp. WH15]
MKAIIYRQYGGPEVLEFTEVPEPKLSQTNVLIRVKAAALNPADHVLQEGLGDSIMDAWFPVIPGWDVAGIVEHAGAGVSEFVPGDEVIGFVREEILRHGTYAEKVSAGVSSFVRKPRNATWAHAAALPLAGLTAYQAIVDALNIREGETLLIHGASGGVGSIAAQIALSRGAKVVGSASESNHSYLRSIGVEPVVYGDRLVEDVRKIIPSGVDAIFDCVGRGVLSLNAQLGRAGVRACSIAGAAPDTKTVFARANQQDLMKLVELVESGALVVPIAATYPLANAAIAQQALRNGRNAPGKVVLEVDG